MPAEAVSPPSATSARASSGSNGDLVRLHITPFDPELLKIVLPASVQAQARNISYHSIETFPEKRYGFVDLPQMEADKIKKKLNGSVLKGVKVRVEKARPEERVEPTGELDEAEKKKKKKNSKSKDESEPSKKRKRDPDVIEGVALKDRKVKRGWTEPVEHKKKKSKKDKDNNGATTEKKKRPKSKYTDKEECLLKTKVPPNAVGNIPEDDLPKKKKKKGKTREVTVHEFEKTTKFPGFLKNDASGADGKPATEFVEGKGWVDEDGNVVEAAKARPTPAPQPKKSSSKLKRPIVEGEEEEDDTTSSSGTSSSGTSSDEEESDQEDGADTKVDSPVAEGKDPHQPSEHAAPLPSKNADNARPISSSSSKSLTIKIPPPITPSATKVHPLEALYKRPKPDDSATETPAQEPQPFSFFDGGDDDDVEDDDDNVPPTTGPPMTPFTRQDFEMRNTRSAAPTPDTAHPSRMHNFFSNDDEMGDTAEEDGYDDEQQQQKKPADGQSSSDFQSWFWENRRELNKSWMKRRKTAAKEKRHRENKARASRAV